MGSTISPSLVNKDGTLVEMDDALPKQQLVNALAADRQVMMPCPCRPMSRPTCSKQAAA
jgi:hypothetical protein